MKILTLPLNHGVSINLAAGEDGWRFVSWATAAGPLSPPAAEALSRRFREVDDALRWFGAICPARISGTGRADGPRAPRIAPSLQMRPRLRIDR